MWGETGEENSHELGQQGSRVTVPAPGFWGPSPNNLLCPSLLNPGVQSPEVTTSTSLVPGWQVPPPAAYDSAFFTDNPLPPMSAGATVCQQLHLAFPRAWIQGSYDSGVQTSGP